MFCVFSNISILYVNGRALYRPTVTAVGKRNEELQQTLFTELQIPLERLALRFNRTKCLAGGNGPF